MSASTLRLVTWNVWFDAHARGRRAAMLADALAAEGADLVCLQEVTAELAEHLRDAASLEGYAWVEGSFAGGDGYGTAMLSRLPVREARRVELPGSMGRDLHLATVALPDGRPLAVGAVHLESRRWNGDVRAEQLAVALPALREAAPESVLCGDFNFDDGWDEERALRAAPDFVDLWPALRGLRDGYTVDTARNAMAAWHKGKVRQTRYDRALLRAPGGAVTARDVALLGDRAHPDDAALFVSDHFGLRVDLALR